jgi:disulfide oxidoreductase YuzD/SAM-dependent methyltransferase
MFEYREFVDNLKIELNLYKSTPIRLWIETANRYVNGFAEKEVRRLVSLEKRRNDGVFFTDSLLAEKVLEVLQPCFNAQSVIYDAACGVGNLLIAASNFIHKHKIQPANKKYLFGTDIHTEFIEAANLRLQMNNLLLLGKKTNKIAQQKRGYSIHKQNGLIVNKFYKAATHIFINPPFDQEKFKEKLGWAAGKVSMAAVFMEKAILFANPGTTIMAILPDVLRSGTRYQKWRNMVEKYCTLEKIELLGQFDEHADVDVYAIKLIKRQEPIEKNIFGLSEEPNSTINLKTVKDFFDICVGPVVDYRDEKKGIQLPYVVSRGLKSWSTQTEVILKRKHLGKSFNCPFVVIKRTSRATDENRAMATIIDCDELVYVDNHLIILKPKSKTLRDCRLAIKILQDERTNKWLNEQIRCRHLTVKIVSNIPIWQ